ncbi:MAG: guanylate kinase [Bacteroidota bacterium]
MDKPRKHKQLIVVAAPSGAGKTTIVRHLLATFDELAFSVSATTRPRRAHEKNGEHYYFLSVDDFKSKIEHGDFLEWEEVYHNQFYGTLSSELDRLSQMGKTVVFDIDVQGAINIKAQFGEDCFTVFVMPPSLETLTLRLQGRKTESPESLKKRIDKAEEELALAPRFDYILLNDQLDVALQESEKIVQYFLDHHRFPS